MPKGVGYGNKRMIDTPKKNPEKKNASDRVVKGKDEKPKKGKKPYKKK